ncbi:MAG TPA: PQQ-binding-like beta-propeller repeat protein, partial [Planctomycetota bacterium]|nr:PQQ-binding-like beta-propeller repeat protein [Planctomycetota bacterium]
MRPLVGYRIGCLAFLLSTFSIPVTAADWQQFRGPGGQGASTEKGIPARFSADENVAWKKELPGPGASSPIVVGDRVIVTSYSGYGRDVEKAGEMEDLRLWVVAMRASDGESLWKREISPRLPESEEVRDHGYAAPTPAS